MEATRPQHRLADLAGLVVLVVEDDSDALELMVSLLESRNARVVGAHNAKEALDTLQRVHPNLIVSDIGMPGEDGYSLMERVRALPRQLGGRTPAIALTAFNQEADRRRALRAGFCRHLSKPVDVTLLCSEIVRLGGGHGPSTQPA